MDNRELYVLYRYCRLLIRENSIELLLTSFIIFILGCILIFHYKGVRQGVRHAMKLLLSEMLIYLYCSTIIFRWTKPFRKYSLTPFWSYEAYQNGEEQLLAENIMNIIVFIPIGFLFGAAFRCMSWGRALMIGMCLSLSIETLQFIFRKGFSEVDDVIHNTVGCMIGYSIYVGMYRIYMTFLRKKVVQNDALE